MNLILDTHVFVWYIDGDPRLPAAISEAVRNVGNQVYLSSEATWEASIKYHLGKWPLPQPPELLFPVARQRHQIASLSIDEGSVIEAAKLPLLHRDPFDRIMIGQAIAHGLMLVTIDAAIHAYPSAPVFALYETM